eukprot:364736-Chlamydomonas_euryale.AAC.3
MIVHDMFWLQLANVQCCQSHSQSYRERIARGVPVQVAVQASAACGLQTATECGSQSGAPCAGHAVC